MEKREIETLIINANIFTGNPDAPNVSDGAIAIDGRRIVAVGPESEIVKAFAGRENIDAAGGIVHPGYIDPHLHLMSVPFHSLSIDPDGTSATQISYSSVKSETDDRSAAAFAATTALTCLKKGYTLIVEPGTLFETDAFADTISAVGSRAMVSAPYGWDDVTLLYELMPGTMSKKLMQRAPASAKRVVDRTERELRRNRVADALVRAFVCLYGIGSNTTELLQDCVALARANGVVYSQHNGYLPEYVEAEERYFGVTDIQRLAKMDALGPGVSLTHMNVVRSADAEVIASTGTNALWSPLNALHRGLHLKHRCHHPQWHKAGNTVAIVSDSAMEYPIGSAGLAALFCPVRWAIGSKRRPRSTCRRSKPRKPFASTMNSAASRRVSGPTSLSGRRRTCPKCR